MCSVLGTRILRGWTSPYHSGAGAEHYTGAVELMWRGLFGRTHRHGLHWL